MRLSTITFATTIVAASLCHAAPVLTDGTYTRELGLGDLEYLGARHEGAVPEPFTAREFDVEEATLSSRANRAGARAGKRGAGISRGGDPSKKRPVARPGARQGGRKGGRPGGRPSGRPAKVGGKQARPQGQPVGQRPGRVGGKQARLQGGRPGAQRPGGGPQPGVRPPPPAAPKKTLFSKVGKFFKSHYKEMGHALNGAVNSYTSYQQSQGKESRLTPAAAVLNGVVNAP